MKFSNSVMVLLLTITLCFTSVSATLAAETLRENTVVLAVDENSNDEDSKNEDEKDNLDSGNLENNENEQEWDNLDNSTPDKLNEESDPANEFSTEETSENIDNVSNEVDENATGAYTEEETAIVEESSEVDTSVEAAASAAFAGGSGTQSDPYKVSTAAQLNAVRNYPEAYFIQTTDIDMSSINNWTPIGKDSNQCFWGGYDGKGHTISNLKIKNDGSETYIGLFGYSDLEIKNLNIKNANIVIDLSLCNKPIQVGTMAGDAPIMNCSTHGTIIVTGSDRYGCSIGGIVGSAQAIEHSHSDVTITVDCNGSKDMYIGGLAGECLQGTASNSYFKGSITTSGDCVYIGGIAGITDQADGISNCVNYGDISVKNDYPGSTVAGIVGIVYAEDNSESVENCVNFGNIVGSEETFAAGITRADGITVHDCYDLGNIEGNPYSGRIYTSDARGVNSYGNHGYENSTVNESTPTGGLLPSGFNGMNRSAEDIKAEVSYILAKCGCEWADPSGDVETQDSLALEPSYRCKEGDTITVTGTFKSSKEQVNSSFKVSDDQSLSLSGTSILTPSDTGEKDTWYISTMISAKKAGSYKIDLTVNDITQSAVLIVEMKEENTVIYYGRDGQKERIHFDYSIDNCLTESALSYNPQLASMLIALSTSAYQGTNDFTLIENSNGNALENPLLITESLNNLGFSYSDGNVIEKNYYKDAFDPNYKENSTAFTIANKVSGNGENIVIVVVRGSYGGFGDDGKFHLNWSRWASDWRGNTNFKNYNQGLHEGFNIAADKVVDELYSFLSQKDIATSNTKFVVTGHSRGAAVANLVSKKLIDGGVSKEKIYDYNFACPDTGRDYDWNWNNGNKYGNIFNINNVKDIVGVIPGNLFNYSLNLNTIIGKLFTHDPDLGILFWGKYGNTRFFSENWGTVDGTIIGDPGEEHQPTYYLDYLSYPNYPSYSSFKSWTEARALLAESASGISYAKKIGRYLGIFCPVNVQILDTNGNVMAEVVDGEQKYYNDSFGDVVILSEGDQCLVYLCENDYKVVLTGYDDGTLDYFVSDIIPADDNSIKEYENIQISKGKRIVAVIDSETEIDDLDLLVADANDNFTKIIQQDGSEYDINEDVGNVEKDNICFIESEKLSSNAIGNSVNIELDKSNYSVQDGNVLSIEATIKTDKNRVEGQGEYIGYFAYYANRKWNQLASWDIEGGTTKYRLKTKMNNWGKYGDVMFTVSVFPKDSFSEGSALIDKVFLVSISPKTTSSEGQQGNDKEGKFGDSLFWSLDQEGTLRISGNGKMPDWTDGSQVPWYNYKSDIKSIVLEEGVTNIGPSAFLKCSNTATVTIPKTVLRIEKHAFDGCKSLATLALPEGISIIGESAFSNCSGLTSVKIPESVTSIGKHAFYGCTGFENISIPNGVTNIGSDAFHREASADKLIIFTHNTYVKEYCKSQGYLFFDKTAPTISKIVSYNGSDIRVYIEKRDGASGYQIKYADNSSMTGAKTVMIKDNNTLSKVISGFKNDKTYYVKLQTYQKIGDKTYWSKWSPAKSIKITQTPYPTNVSKLSTFIGSHIKVDWTKTAGASGYHIKYADNANMTGAKEVMVKGNSTFTKTLTGLKNGKTYYVKIQTYRTVSGKTYWSSWSPVKSIKVDQKPYGSSISKLTNPSSKAMKITWDKVSSSSGYHIQYATNSSMTGAKDIMANNKDTLSKTVTGLTKGKTYYVRIQTFRKVSGKTYWSSWSKAKQIKITK